MHFKFFAWFGVNIENTWSSWRCPLAIHDHSDKLLVVDVALGILLIGQQLLHFLVGEFLAQGGQQMPQLGRGDEATGVLVEVAESFDEVVGRVTGASLNDGLVNG